MKNLLTYRIESSLGATYISLLALFFIGLMFTAVKNFESDLDIMTSTAVAAGPGKASQSELVLIREWVSANNIEIPKDRGFRYLVRKYPDKPWLE